MVRNKKESSTEVKKEKKTTAKKVIKKPNVNKNIKITEKVVDVLDGVQDKDKDVVNSNYVRVGDSSVSSLGVITTSTDTTDTVYYDSGYTTTTGIGKQTFINQGLPNSYPIDYIAPVKPIEDKSLTFLNSIESELIGLNSKMSELLKKDDVMVDDLTYQDLFEIKKHLADTINRHNYPGSAGNIHMQRAQRRYEIIEIEINNKLNVLFGDV